MGISKQIRGGFEGKRGRRVKGSGPCEKISREVVFLPSCSLDFRQIVSLRTKFHTRTLLADSHASHASELVDSHTMGAALREIPMSRPSTPPILPVPFDFTSSSLFYFCLHRHHPLQAHLLLYWYCLESFRYPYSDFRPSFCSC